MRQPFKVFNVSATIHLKGKYETYLSALFDVFESATGYLGYIGTEYIGF